MAAAVRSLNFAKTQLQIKLPLPPDLFYRVMSFTKTIDICPGTDVLKNLTRDHSIAYVNSSNLKETHCCQVLFIRTFPSFADFCQQHPSDIGKVYPGIDSVDIAKKLYEDSNGPLGEIVAIYLQPLRFEAISPELTHVKRTLSDGLSGRAVKKPKKTQEEQ